MISQRKRANAPVGGAATASGLPERVCLEIDRDKLLALLRDRHLCASDFHCPDCSARDCVWRLVLNACTEKPGS